MSKKNVSVTSLIPFIGVAVGGGFLIWSLIDARSAGQAYRRGRKAIEDTTGARLARPDMAVRGPTTPEDFEVLAEAMQNAIEEICAESHTRGMPILKATSTEFADEVTRRTLASLYPEFPWPAITGDHASTLELQGLLRYLVLSGDSQALCVPDEEFPDVDLDDELDQDLDEDFEPAPME